MYVYMLKRSRATSRCMLSSLIKYRIKYSIVNGENKTDLYRQLLVI